MDTLRLILVCMRVGALVFGGGMAMIPLMEGDVVRRYAWLTPRQFVDAVAIGQLTPGPLLVTVTLIGYKVGGVLAATLATVAIFLPSFLMTIVATRQLEKVRNNAYVRGFLKGVRPTIVGLIGAAVISIGHSSLVDWKTGFLAAAALFLLIRFKLDPALIVVGAGILGLVLFR